MTDEERPLLAAYVHSFNARDFDAVRCLVAEDVRLDVVGRTRMRGRTEAGRYFGNYASQADWHLAVGLVEGLPAVLVRRAGDPAGPVAYFVFLRFTGGQVTEIRDFRYAAHVVADAEVTVLGTTSWSGRDRQEDV
jgi:RNA polymerase sigma-70 factor, ECF subfamily